MAGITATPCECSLFEAFIPEQLTDETIESGDFDTLTTGCTATTKRTFAPGHDAKLKSFLIKHEAAGNEIRRNDGIAVTADAMGHARRYDFAHLVAAGIEKAQAKAEARATRAATKAANAAKPKATKADAAGGTTHRSWRPIGTAAVHDGNEARQAREANSLAEVVAAEEAKHVAEQAASRPVPEWDDEAKSVDLTDEPEVIAKVGRWEYKGIEKGGVFYYLAKDGHTRKEATSYTVVRAI